MSSGIWIEFGAIALAHGLAVASPGPDFTLILRQSLRYGRATALRSALGIGCGILVHVSYALMGLGLLVRNSPGAFTLLKLAGAGYLAWMGWRALRSTGPQELEVEESASTVPQRGAWRRGFLTNVLNPKAALFFVTLYTVLVSPETSRGWQALYGAWMAVWTLGWFSLVALVFTRPALRRSYLRMGVWVDRVLGVVFIAFAVNVLLAKV